MAPQGGGRFHTIIGDNVPTNHYAVTVGDDDLPLLGERLTRCLHFNLKILMD